MIGAGSNASRPPWVRNSALALTIAGALFAAPAPAGADISVNPAVILFELGATNRTIVVTNEGQEIAFVTARVRTVSTPGQKNENLRASQNPAELGLIVSPARLALEPGEQRGVRLMAMAPAGESDRVWRVQFSPQVGELKAGQSGVAFVIAYDALVIQRAANPKPSLAGSRLGRTLTLANRGNSFVMVNSVEQCRGRECTSIPGKRLYAGQAWSTELPSPDAPVDVKLQVVGGREETLRI